MPRSAPSYLTVSQFLKAHQGVIGKTMLYEALHQKTIPSIKVGGKFLIPADAFDRVLESETTVTA